MENLNRETSCTTPRMCHAIFAEGGVALGAKTVAHQRMNQRVVFLLVEGMLVALRMCGKHMRATFSKSYGRSIISRFTPHAILDINFLSVDCS